MKRIKNTSFQALEVFLLTGNGPKTYWLKPKEVIIIPTSYVGTQIKTLESRRMIAVANA